MLNDPLIPPNRDDRLVLVDHMTLRTAQFFEAVSLQLNQNIPASGTGSPEGVLSAEPFKSYYDTAAASGTGHYVKMTGAGNTGWKLQ